MTDLERVSILKLIKEEVIPAIGCTEPIAVALAVCKAKELLGVMPTEIVLFLSPNILKNAMGVGIPGTGMIGLPIAIALGALIGRSEDQLEVLKACTPEAVAIGKQWIDEKRISIAIKEDVADKLYIEAICKTETEWAKVIIRNEHTQVCCMEKNGETIQEDLFLSQQVADQKSSLTMRQVFDFAIESPIEALKFVLEAGKLNKRAAEKSLLGNYGHALGKTFASQNQQRVMGDSIFSKILSYTSAACDARMAGAMIPVMSNSGSGNQGISATLPVVIYAEETDQPEEKLIRALIISHLTSIYIKQHLGRLSALCGCVVAATGSSCGITYLMGGNFDQICYAVKNMAANLTGMVCDGAKPSCSLKVSSGVSTAVYAAMMAMENKVVTGLEGIIDDDVDKTIRNLALIGSEGMNEMDRLVLKIMTCK